MDERIFRPVRPDDIEAIAAMAVRAWEPIFASYRRMLGDAMYDALHTGWQERKAEQVRQAARSRPECVWVTEVAGALAGFITFSVNQEAGRGTIGNNAVEPAFQSRGIGTFQYRRVLRLLRQRGVRFVDVTTGLDEGHAPARRSYEKAGFQRQVPSVTYFLDLNEWEDAGQGDRAATGVSPASAEAPMGGEAHACRPSGAAT